MWGSHPLLLMEKLWVLSYLPIVCQWWVLWWVCVPAFLPALGCTALQAVTRCIMTTQLAFGFFFFLREYYSICHCKFTVSKGGGEFRISLYYHPELFNSFSKLFFIQTRWWALARAGYTPVVFHEPQVKCRHLCLWLENR